MKKFLNVWPLILTVACCLPLLETVDLPSSFKVCPRASPNLASCVKESIEQIRPKLKNGDFGSGFVIDPLEPISIEDINIQRGSGFYVNCANLKASGATNFRINKLRINLDPFRVDVIVDVPKIEAVGKYKLNLALGVLTLKGDGDVKANIDNIKLKIRLNGSKYMKNGEEYLKIDKCDLVIKIETLRLKFDNLFNGDKVLGDLGNQLVNQNIDLFTKDIEPSLQRSLSSQFMKSANQVLEKAPFKVLMP